MVLPEFMSQSENGQLATIVNTTADFAARLVAKGDKN
jgi:hypothetical protein